MKLKKKKKSIFITSGFEESTLIYLFKFISTYSLKYNIDNIFFEDKNTLEKFKKYSKLLKLEKIDLLHKNKFLPWWYQISLLKFLTIPLLNLSNFFFLIFNSNKENFKKKLDWDKSQIIHSLWDKNNYTINEKNFKTNFYDYLKNIFNILNTIYISSKLKKNQNIKVIFLSHPVYQYRVYLSKLRKDKIVYILGVFNLYRNQYLKKDNDWNFVDKKLFNFINNKPYINKYTKNYWTQRNLGKSNYEGAKLASNINSKKKVNKNYIFLHIFKDSPFRVIDNSRIFVDYFEWFKNTLKIINQSNAIWTIRLHPSYKNWGENQIHIVKQLLKLTNNFNNKNLIIDDMKNSNLNIFKNAEKIVTYSGTSATEAIAYGLKPIIISETPCSNLIKDSSFKPRSLNEYSNLLNNKKISDFKAKKNNKILARKLIYIQEKLLRFDKDIDAKEIYRCHSKSQKLKNIKKILKKINRTDLFNKNVDSINNFKTTFSNEFYKKYHDK